MVVTTTNIGAVLIWKIVMQPSVAIQYLGHIQPVQNASIPDCIKGGNIFFMACSNG